MFHQVDCSVTTFTVWVDPHAHDSCKIGSGGQHIANRPKSDECSWSVLDYMYIDFFKIKRKSSVQRYRKIFIFQSYNIFFTKQ